jgi:Ca2+-binding RTX toxin-like protein
MGMRRTFTLLASVALAMLLVSGAAWAANHVRCPSGEGEPCVGTGRADEIGGTRGDDDIRALGGADVVRGGGGDDEVRGGGGADRIGFDGLCGSTETFAGG